MQANRTNRHAPSALAAVEVLLVAAHPDDETIGAGATLRYLPGCTVLHVTSGAPRDRRFLPEDFTGSHEAYAALRRKELEAAMALADLDPERLRTLGATDQDVALALPALTQALVGVFLETRPVVVITQPYEGGHPDHDATAFMVHAAAELARRRAGFEPLILEMTSYHAGPAGLVTGEFLGGGGGPVLTFTLPPEERRHKERMLACFRSQRRVLTAFTVAAERFRVAPRYEFTRPPHPGRLHYERLSWPMTGDHFRALAEEALASLALERTACL